MATVHIDVGFKPAKKVIQEAVDKSTLSGAHFVKQKADQFVPVGKIKRSVYKKGKAKGQSWTWRRPGQLKRSAQVFKSKFAGGGGVLMYGSFNVFYGFMRHWGTKKVKAAPWLKKAEEAAASQIEKEVAGRIKEALR